MTPVLDEKHTFNDGIGLFKAANLSFTPKGREKAGESFLLPLFFTSSRQGCLT